MWEHLPNVPVDQAISDIDVGEVLRHQEGNERPFEVMFEANAKLGMPEELQGRSRVQSNGHHVIRIPTRA